MKKKIIGILVCVLLIGIVCQTTVAADETFSNIITVDDDGDADYTRIQDAINNASDGDTVFVYSGVYDEYLSVVKSICLIGEDRDSTIILGGVFLKVSNISICNFTIESNDLNYGVGIGCMYYDNQVIMNNIIRYYKSGLDFFNSENNMICNNSIVDNLIGVQFNKIRDNNDILDNMISNNEYGGVVVRGAGVRLSRNVISNNSFGIWFATSTYNMIVQNDVLSNSEYGILFDGGNVHGDEFYFNNFVNNGRHVYESDSSVVSWILSIIFESSHWDRNYWDDWIGLKSEELSFLPYYIPFLNFDWHPAREPYSLIP